MKKLSDHIGRLCDDQRDFVLVTLVNIRGSAPQDVGAKMLVGPSGLIEGTVGGGRFEARAITYAQEMIRLRTKAPVLTTWNLQRDIGMSCGGEASLFFEPYLPSHWEIVVFGAGHVSQALCRLLVTLDCRVNVYDSRQEWLDRLPKAPNLHRNCCADFPAQVSALSPQSFIVSITQGHNVDLPVLKAVLTQPVNFPYVGVMGSDVKGRRIRAELRDAGVEQGRIDSLACPIGLQIGGNSPEEIAISICAQLISLRDRDTRPSDAPKMSHSESFQPVN